MPSFSLIAITGQSSYPLNSENASPFGICRVYLSCAEIATPAAKTAIDAEIPRLVNVLFFIMASLPFGFAVDIPSSHCLLRDTGLRQPSLTKNMITVVGAPFGTKHVRDGLRRRRKAPQATTRPIHP